MSGFQGMNLEADRSGTAYVQEAHIEVRALEDLDLHVV